MARPRGSDSGTERRGSYNGDLSLSEMLKVGDKIKMLRFGVGDLLDLKRGGSLLGPPQADNDRQAANQQKTAFPNCPSS